MTPARGARRRTMEEAAIWQELEFGSYRADLPLWEGLAAVRRDSPDRSGEGDATLELGAGAGRVAMELARQGHPVLAVERSVELARDLERRAAEEGLPLTVLGADLEGLNGGELPLPIGAAIAPLHLIQQLEPDARRSLLSALARALPAGGRLGATVVDERSLLGDDLEASPLPDMREIDGWVYSSEPLWVQVDEREIRVRRLRKRVSPEGEIESAVHDELLHRLPPEELEAEAAEAGLRAVERRALPAGRAESDSIAVILEAR